MSSYQYELGEKRIESFNPQHQYKERNRRHYRGSSSTIIGYIGSVSDQDILTRRFNVHIPEFGNQRIRAPLLTDLQNVSTQGTGARGFAPEIGTPVLLQYLHESNQLVIIGGMNLSGLDFGEIIGNEGRIPSIDNPINSVWNSPVNHSLLELGVDSSITVSPYIGRGSNNIYNAPVANIIPGDISITNRGGVNFNSYTNLHTNVAPFLITRAQGNEATLEQRALQNAVREYELLKDNLERLVDRDYVFERSSIIPARILRILRPILTAQDPIDFNSPEGRAILGQVGINALNAYFNLGDKVTGLVDNAIRYINAGIKFLEWLDRDMGSIIEELVSAFGTVDLNLGTIGISLNISMDSITATLNLRTGLPIVDRVVNRVANKLITKLLEDFSLSSLFGEDFLGGRLFGSGGLDPSKTFLVNLLTQTLRLRGTINPGDNTIGSILTELKDIPNIILPDIEEELLELQENSLVPNIAVVNNSQSNEQNIDITNLSNFIVSRGYPLGGVLPYILKELVESQSIEVLLIAIAPLLTETEQIIELIFYYGYIVKDDNKVTRFINSILTTSPRIRERLTNRYNWQSLTKEQIYEELVELDNEEPLDLTAIADVNKIYEHFSKYGERIAEGIQFLQQGQISDYINQVLIIQIQKDLRLTLNLYLELKQLVNTLF